MLHNVFRIKKIFYLKII